MYPGTFGWIGKLQPETEYDLIITTTWQNAAAYSNVQALYAGEIGALYGVRFLVTNQGYVTAGTTPYYASAFQIDGSAVTPKWSGGVAPTAGNASSIDSYSFTIIKTASATFTVLGAQSKFA